MPFNNIKVLYYLLPLNSYKTVYYYIHGKYTHCRAAVNVL